ncbi:MAG: NifU family protein [Bdellovibrionaceae bacterium]|nr:NifU family protein [Pseudobdellovibrionaceae bacterium]MDW8191096.1 NifU family protein [Pseudobdellovibrionaceae bacterium]
MILIRVAPTPNPSARKFILDRPVLLQGKATFTNPEECGDVRLASDLFSIEGVRQVHFFENVITVTVRFDVDFDEVQDSILAVIQTRMPVHDPNFNRKNVPEKSREDLPPEVRQIEEILDRRVRPGLQGDGGDIEVIKVENQQVFVRYQGACGTCPSSTTGTLMGIESILSEELGYQVEVLPID